MLGYACIIAAALVVAISFHTLAPIGLRPVAGSYQVSIATGAHPQSMPEPIAAIAQRYLDDQTPELAAPELHQDPTISRVAAVFARNARGLEAGIPEDQVDADPTRLVWVVWAAGDFLDLHDFPWSSPGTPYPEGRIVIDDATQSILGVYPHPAGT